MKLTLITLLLIGVAASAQNLRGDQDELMLLNDLAVRELKKDKTSEKKVKDASEGLGKSECGKGKPCANGQKCEKGICVLKNDSTRGQGCNADGDCGDNKVCRRKKCVKDSTPGQGCNADGDCGDNERCKTRRSSGSTCVCKYGYTRRNGECKKSKKYQFGYECDGDEDCDQGEKCRKLGPGYNRRCVNKSWYRKTGHRCFNKHDCADHGVCRRFRFGRRSCLCDKHYGGRRCDRCAWRWKGDNCGYRRRYYKKYFHRNYDCDTEVKVVAVVTDNDDDEKTECVINLRTDEDLIDFLENDFEPEKLEDLDVAEVDPCTPAKLEEELDDLQADRDLTDSDVKVVFVVVKEDDFVRDNHKCEGELDNLQFKLEDLRCNDIDELEDFITIEVDSSTKCQSEEMKEAVLEENDNLKN